MSGSITIARASATRRAMPPDSCCGISRAAPRRPTACSLVSTTRADQPLGQARVLAQRERHVLEDVDVREQRAVLEQHAHAPAQRVQRCAVESRDVAAVDDDLARVGVDLPGDQPQQRGLAGAARTHDGRDRAPADADVEPAEDRLAVHGVVHAAQHGDVVLVRDGGCAGTGAVDGSRDFSPQIQAGDRCQAEARRARSRSEKRWQIMNILRLHP